MLKKSEHKIFILDGGHPKIYLLHKKIRYRQQIRSEIDRMGDSHVHNLQDGEVFRI